MNCINCGAPLDDGSEFCTGCGQPVLTAPARKSDSGMNTIMLIFMASAIILASLGLLFFPVADGVLIQYNDDKLRFILTNIGNLHNFLYSLDVCDGDFSETFGHLLDNRTDSIIWHCFFVTVITCALSMIFYLVGLVLALCKKHVKSSASARFLRQSAISPF